MTPVSSEERSVVVRANDGAFDEVLIFAVAASAVLVIGGEGGDEVRDRSMG